jgi:hypothetical protein
LRTLSYGSTRGTRMARQPLKPKAETRTIDIFSGKTQLEEQDEQQRIAADTDLENTKAKEREPLTLDNLNAHLAEYATARFDNLDGYKLTECKDGKAWLLSRVGYGGGSYGGLYVPTENVVELAKVFVLAAKKILGVAQGGKSCN